MHLIVLALLNSNHIFKSKLAYIYPSYHNLKFHYKMHNLKTDSQCLSPCKMTKTNQKKDKSYIF